MFQEVVGQLFEEAVLLLLKIGRQRGVFVGGFEGFGAT